MSFSVDKASEDNPGLKKYPSSRFDIGKVGKSDSLVKFKFGDHLTVPDAAENIAATQQPSSLVSSEGKNLLIDTKYETESSNAIPEEDEFIL